MHSYKGRQVQDPIKWGYANLYEQLLIWPRIDELDKELVGGETERNENLYNTAAVQTD